MDLRVTYVSPSITSLRGYSVEEVMAQTLEQSMTPASAELSAKVFMEELALEAPFGVLVIPDSLPKTKPKACNYGLYTCDSDLLVIYDAEDRPEPDQLKKAVVAFGKLPEDVICLQAKLNYYNSRQNLLTRWCTVEYSTTFDLLLPGLQCANIPMPLGGTSNHFRMQVLKELEGWDPFNVTEDCDLGVRLYRMGYETRMIDSTTWEEAPSRLPVWGTGTR